MSDDKKFGLWLNRKGAKDADAAPAGAAAPKNVKQRWVMVFAAVAGFAVIASSVFTTPDAPVKVAPKADSQLVDMTPKGAEQQTWQRTSQQDIANLTNSIRDLKTDNQSLTRKLAEIQDRGAKPVESSLPPGAVPPPSMVGANSQMASLPAVIPPPPMAPASSKVMNLPPIDAVSAEAPSAEPLAFKPEKRATGGPTGGTMTQIGASASKAAESVKSSINYRKNQYSGMLPPGSFAPIALLNGLDAGTSVANQSNPQPVLMQIQDNATLPGAANYKLKSCFALGSAYGDLSAERVYVRLARLSCVDKANHLILTAAVQGYVVDSDGKLGLRGILVDRQGARLGKALLAGFAQGLSSALGAAQGTTSTSALGATTSLTGQDALKASGLTGASGAATQLAQFYLKEAQAIFPVITVDTGRTATLVFSDSVNLKWGDGDAAFAKEVTPQ